ncbi:MAG TPA: hypothetical protein VH186_03955 [Chloroflexia bacterium]|nr:hypothetical protein [Chloroflexia bacterium]
MDELNKSAGDEEFVDYKAAMEFLGLKQATFFRRVREGIIPSYEDTLRPKRRVFKIADLKQVKANQYRPIKGNE